MSAITSEVKFSAQGGLNGAAQCLEQTNAALEKIWRSKEYVLTDDEISVAREIHGVIENRLLEGRVWLNKFAALVKAREGQEV